MTGHGIGRTVTQAIALATLLLASPAALADPGLSPLNRWYLLINTVRRGPMSADQVRRTMRAAPAGTEVLVWRKGMKEWTEPWRTQAFAGMTPSMIGETNEEHPSSRHFHQGFITSVFIGGGWGGIFDDERGKLTFTNAPGAVLAMTWGYSFKDFTALQLEVLLGLPQIFGIGLNLRFFLPHNFWVAGSIGSGAPTRFYGKLAAGKEWWTSDEWAIGIALTGIGSAAGSDEDFISWDNSATVALGFTATFN